VSDIRRLAVRRAELEHLVRAACELTGDDEIIVIGSQAIHASIPEEKLPSPTTLSNEADLWPIGAQDEHDPRVAQIEGALGEDSPFHRTHRVYGDGVDATTATLPPGWEARLVRFESVNTNGKVGLCLERHDLCIAKLVAGRPKDLAFIDSLLQAHRLNEVTLVERLASLKLGGEKRDLVHARLAALTGLDVERVIADLST
jgi:hypothetical protein